jgi:hypothetical protein
MFWTRITVEERERAVVAQHRRVLTILTPGDYRIVARKRTLLSVERHSVSELVFQSIWADSIVRFHPELLERHFYRVETNETQLALVYVDGGLNTVLTPSKRLLFWRGLAQITAEFVEVIGTMKRSATKQRTPFARV